LTCSEDEPCDVFLELASVEGVGSTIFAAGNLHTVTTTLYGVLLASGDGGKTWTKIDDASYNVCRKAKHGKLVLLAGNGGKIGIFKM